MDDSSSFQPEADNSNAVFMYSPLGGLIYKSPGSGGKSDINSIVIG